MESEKVKKIKLALKDHSIEKLKYKDGIKIKEISFADILTLINELEKEIAKNANCLKQLAERLQEKICKIFDDKVLFLEDLDETLKEFIKWFALVKIARIKVAELITTNARNINNMWSGEIISIIKNVKKKICFMVEKEIVAIETNENYGIKNKSR